MATFKIESLGLVQNAISAVKNVHGGYQAIDLLTKAMSNVDTPDDFDEEVKEAERVSGMRYEGPDGAVRSLLKTIETAANESGPNKSALIELTSLVLIKLGSIQGSKILIGLLAVAGVKPVLGAVVVQVLVMMMQSESGRSIVKNSWPQIQKYVGQLWQHSELRGHIADVAHRVGDEGSAWLDKAKSAPQEAVQIIKDAGDSLMDGLNDLFIAQPVKKNPPDEKA